MGAEEFIDDESLDPKELFDASKYSTLIVDREGFSRKENESADLMDDLLDKNISREEQEEIFKKLKENKAQSLLIQAISNSKNNKDKARLISAVWESGVDISNEFLFFVRLACDADFEVAMEALTVIENLETKVDDEVLKNAMIIAQNDKTGKTELVNELIECLKQFGQ